MRLTQHTDYALRVLIYLGLKGEALATIQEIAEAYRISNNHLMKVTRKLANCGYVESIRGAGGGLRLRQDPAFINLGQVVQDMEPEFGLAECMREGNACVITAACALPAVLRRAQEAFMAELLARSLADILPHNRRAPLAQLLKLDPKPGQCAEVQSAEK